MTKSKQPRKTLRTDAWTLVADCAGCNSRLAATDDTLGALADLRRRVVWLTETGARRLEVAIPFWRRANAKLAKSFSPSLARQLAYQAGALMQSEATWSEE